MSSPTPGPSKAISHLSYPIADSLHDTLPTSPPPPRQLLKDRLYVGNLHSTVDEYTLLQLFSKFGKVTKLDFLFHKSGPLKGKPRGYAFVEYGTQEEALRALASANDKLLRGRKLVVTFAHQAPLDQAGSTGGHGSKHRKGHMDAAKPTTLSLLKTGMKERNEATADKIAMMEAKLRQMEGHSRSLASSSSLASALPSKPAFSPFDSRAVPQLSSSKKNAQLNARKVLPSLPIQRQSSGHSVTGTVASIAQPAQSKTTKSSAIKLAGVRVGGRRNP